MTADGHPTTGGSAQPEEGLRGAVESDHLFGLSGTGRGGAAITSAG
jgi:hypothetical protein